MWSAPGGVVLLFLYNYVQSITINIQLLCNLLCSYWLLRSGIPDFQNFTIVAFHLNFTT